MLEKIKDFFNCIKWIMRYSELHCKYNKLLIEYRDLREQIDEDFVEVIT